MQEWDIRTTGDRSARAGVEDGCRCAYGMVEEDHRAASTGRSKRGDNLPGVRPSELYANAPLHASARGGSVGDQWLYERNTEEIDGCGLKIED